MNVEAKVSQETVTPKGTPKGSPRNTPRKAKRGSQRKSIRNSPRVVDKKKRKNEEIEKRMPNKHEEMERGITNKNEEIEKGIPNKNEEMEKRITNNDTLRIHQETPRSEDTVDEKEHVNDVKEESLQEDGIIKPVRDIDTVDKSEDKQIKMVSPQNKEASQPVDKRRKDNSNVSVSSKSDLDVFHSRMISSGSHDTLPTPTSRENSKDMIVIKKKKKRDEKKKDEDPLGVPNDSVHKKDSRGSSYDSIKRDNISPRTITSPQTVTSPWTLQPLHSLNVSEDHSLHSPSEASPLTTPKSHLSSFPRKEHPSESLKSIKDCLREFYVHAKRFLKHLKRLDERYFTPGLKKGVYDFSKISEGFSTFISTYSTQLKQLDKKLKSTEWNFGAFFLYLFSILEIPLRHYRMAQLQLSTILEREEGAPSRLELFIAMTKQYKDDCSFHDLLMAPIYYIHTIIPITARLTLLTPLNHEAYEDMASSHRSFEQLGYVVSYLDTKDAVDQEEVKVMEQRLIFKQNRLKIFNGKRRILDQWNMGLYESKGRIHKIKGILMDDLILLCQEKNNKEEQKNTNKEEEKKNYKESLDKYEGYTNDSSMIKTKSDKSLNGIKIEKHTPSKTHNTSFKSQVSSPIGSPSPNSLHLPIESTDVDSYLMYPSMLYPFMDSIHPQWVVIAYIPLNRVFMVDPQDGMHYTEDLSSDYILKQCLEIAEMGVGIYRLIFASYAEKYQWKTKMDMALSKIHVTYTHFEIPPMYRWILYDKNDDKKKGGDDRKKNDDDRKKSEEKHHPDVHSKSSSTLPPSDDFFRSCQPIIRNTASSPTSFDALFQWEGEWPSHYSWSAVHSETFHGLYGNRLENEQKIWEEIIQLNESVDCRISRIEKKQKEEEMKKKKEDKRRLRDMDEGRGNNEKFNHDMDHKDALNRNTLRMERQSKSTPNMDTVQKKSPYKETNNVRPKDDNSMENPSKEVLSAILDRLNILEKRRQEDSDKILQLQRSQEEDRERIQTFEARHQQDSNKITELESLRVENAVKVEKLERVIVLMREQHLADNQKIMDLMESLKRPIVSPPSEIIVPRKGRRTNRHLNVEAMYGEHDSSESYSLKSTGLEDTDSSSSRKKIDHRKPRHGKFNRSTKDEVSDEKVTGESQSVTTANTHELEIPSPKLKTKKLKNTKFNPEDIQGSSWREKTLRRFGFSSSKKRDLSLSSPWRSNPSPDHVKQNRLSISKPKKVDWSNVKGENYFSDDFGDDFDRHNYFVQSDYVRNEYTPSPKEEFSDYSDGEYHKMRRRIEMERAHM